MEMKNTFKQSGNVRISVAVIEKVAKLAAIEIEGVKDVSVGTTGVRGIFAKTNIPKAVEVNMYDGVADITLHIVIKYGYKLSTVCKEVQQSVKSSVQSMVNITVSKVNIVVTGVEAVEQE